MVKTGVEQMLSWIERKKQPTFRSEHKSVWKAIWERLVQTPSDRVKLRHVPARLVWSDVEAGILSWEDWEGNVAADVHAKEGAKKSEPPQQMTSEYVRKRHMIQNAQMAAVHINEWRDHNLDIAPEAKFDEEAGGGGEGARQAQAKLLFQCKKTEEMKGGTLRSVKPCKKMNELKEEERSHLRDVWIENRNQDGFQSERIALRWPVHWEVTDRKDTWSDEFLLAVRAYFGALEVLKMTDEQSEENFDRKTTWTTMASDFEIATATMIPTDRGQAMAKGMGVYRHKEQTLRQMWKQVMMMREMEEMAKLMTEQASDLMFVGMPRAEGFSKGVKLRCEVKVVECVMKWL